MKVDEDYVPYVESKPGRRGSSRAAKKLFVTVAAADSDVPEDAEAVRPLDEEMFEINIVDDVAATDLEIVGQIARVLEGGVTDYDGDLIQDDKVFHRIRIDANEEIELPADMSRLTKEHRTLHYPAMPKACPGCRGGKHAKWPSRRRTTSGIAIHSADSEEKPFGACVHLDHVVMQVGSSAARSAKVCLNTLDERTKFAEVFPSNSRDADTVLAAHHEFDNPVPEVRRWWSDNAPDFAAASRKIRTMRPFAHYRSIPRAPQTNGIIERFNRTVVEGARASLLMAAFPDSWWVCAIHHWCMQYNGHCRGTDGFTPHDRRYGCVAEYSSYPFGALVFVAARPNGKAKSSKWEPRMKPHVLVDVGSGPGFAWNKTYGVVKLGHLLGKDRPSRTGIRYSAEVVFPDRVVYTVRLRLRLARGIQGFELP